MPQEKGKEIGEISGVKEKSSSDDRLIPSSEQKMKEEEIVKVETSKAKDDLMKSFQRKIDEMKKKRKLPYTRPTIVSRNNTLTESVQSYQKPRLLSIGPLHRGDVNLKPMEDFKWSFVCIILSSVGSSSDEKLSGCFVKLKELEEKCRRTYSVFIDMTSDDFVQMLFLDACFIVLLKMAELDDPKKRFSLSKEQKDLLSDSKIREILTKLRSLNVDELIENVTIASRDTLVLENQIPFFILAHMWKWILETLEIESQLDFIRCHRFVQRERIFNPEQIHHYLHLYHCCNVPRPSERFDLCGRYHRLWIPSATDLKQSGIDFMLEKPGDNFCLDIRFEKGVVHIPEKLLDEEFRALVHNLVDFEQSVRGDHPTYYSNYVWIMSRLLSTEDDVRILGKRSSFRYQKGWDKDVQPFFNDLERRCSYWKVGDEIKKTFDAINVYALSKKREWKKTMQRKFCCSDKWYTLTVYGSIVLFILTFLQTFYAMYAYSHPTSSPCSPSSPSSPSYPS